MTQYIYPIKIGSLKLASNIFYAPLAGCSDYPFRKMGTQFSPGLMFCEMVKMEALIRYEKNTFSLLDFDPSMFPIGAQICGSNPKLAGKSAKIIEDLGFSLVDLNCGCPVDKVTKDGSGSGMLKHPKLIGDVLSEMKAAVSIPVTIKIRIGWDEQNILAKEITQIAEEAGSSMITIHGRTREQGYRGVANRQHIKHAKQAAKTIKVIANGDIFHGIDAISMLEETGADGVLVARGTMGKPWIAEDIRRADQNLPPLFFEGERYRLLLLNHLEYILKYRNDKKALLDLKRVGCFYLKHGVGTKPLRETLNRCKHIEDAKKLLLSYPWEEASIGKNQQVHAYV